MSLAAKVPHFHYVDEINCNALVELKTAFQRINPYPDVKHTFLPILVKSLSMALTKYPSLNSCFKEDSMEVIFKGSDNIEVAMATPNGLVVPNIKNVQSLSILQMVDIYAVPVFYHGGHFGKGPGGTLEYIGGKVEKFPEMDLDFVNFGDLVTLFKGLGYATYRAVYWYDPTSNDLESGLHILRGDAGINEMRENKLRNSNINEFYIYFDHAVDEPQIVEEEAAAEQGPEEFDDAVDVDSIMRELQSSPSTAGDGNGSGDDDLYEPPPNGTETGSDDDSSSCDEENDLMKKRSTVKGKEKVMPRRRVTVKEGPGAESSGNKRGAGRKTAGVPSDKGTMPAAKPKGTGPSARPKRTRPTAKPKGSVPHHKPQKTGAAVHAEEDVPYVQPNDGPPIGLYVNEEESDDDDPVYEYASEDLHTPVSSEDEGDKHEFPVFNEDYGFGEGRFEVGTKFATIDGFKEVVKDMFIAEGRELLWIKNDKERVRVACRGENCPWLAHLSYNKTLLCFQVKTYKSEHTCARDLGSNAADQHWINKKVEKRMGSQPHMTTNEATDFLREEFNLVVHPKMVYKAVKEANERLVGNEKEQYGKLREYGMEILKSNPGSTARIDVKPIPQSLPVFDKMYICFEGCKQGFKSGCRPFIHLDGAFLKTYHGGQLLSAVAQDANNQFYVVAFAVARSETKESWKWFLTLLQEDLGDASQFGWNFMSDQQKGLLPALKEVMPRAHHRNCVMHIWKNFINRFKNMHIRDIVWECARCTTEPEFKEKMDRLKGVNNAAWEYLMKFEPTTWVKAYFSHGPKVDNLTNNV
ncbi:uncharacterized protein [Arachis hypogaea]|uniref:uncharacterized protein isoform X1 n=2 Tax=Arachis hypogaea TaxID=3818 RepID=UPI000DEC7283|nr:uncharacterized protein LOC112703795 isoform X1 [Arachis hypogaea]